MDCFLNAASGAFDIFADPLNRVAARQRGAEEGRDEAKQDSVLGIHDPFLCRIGGASVKLLPRDAGAGLLLAFPDA